MAWLDKFPAYFNHSHLSSVYLTEKYAIKASPYGKYRLFLDREYEFYKMASTQNGHNILPFHGSFKTPKSTFICMSRAKPIIGAGRHALSLFSKLVLTLKWLHTECRLVHCDIRPHNIMCFKGSPVLIDFAFSESTYYPNIRELLEVTKKSLYPVFLELYSILMKTDIDHSDFFEQINSEIYKTISLLDLELASSVKKRVIPLFEDFRRQGDFEGASKYIKLVHAIIEYEFEPYRKYRGTYWTASDRILESLANDLYPCIMPADDLESLVKTFFLLFDEPLFKRIKLISDYGDLFEFWRDFAEDSLQNKSMLEASRSLDYEQVIELMDLQMSWKRKK